MNKYQQILNDSFSNKTLFEETLKTFPEQSRENIRFLYDGNFLGVEEAYLHAREMMENYEKDDEAEDILEDMIEKVERLNPPKEDAHFLYYSLHDKLEEYLCDYMNSSGKVVLKTKEDYGSIYQLMGGLCLAGQRLEEAKSYFELSLQWNPYDAETRLFLIEVLKMNDQLEQLFFENKRLLKMAASSLCISIVYQNFAYYYVQKKDFKSALYAFIMATNYGMEPDPYSFNLFEQIEKEVDDMDPDPQEIYTYFISKGIPVPPDDDLYEYFLEKAMDADADEDIETSMYCLNVCDDIKNSLEQESEDEQQIRTRFNRKLNKRIRAYNQHPSKQEKEEIIELLKMSKVYVSFCLELPDDEFPCALVESVSKDLFLSAYLFPSKIPMHQKEDYEIRYVPFNFCLGLLSAWDQLEGVVLHPFSDDVLEISREEFME